MRKGLLIIRACCISSLSAHGCDALYFATDKLDLMEQILK